MIIGGRKGIRGGEGKRGNGGGRKKGGENDVVLWGIKGVKGGGIIAGVFGRKWIKGGSDGRFV